MPETHGVPEIYVDFAQIATGNLGIFLGFHAINPLSPGSPEVADSEPRSQPPSDLKAIVRFSQEQAKAFAIMLRRSLKTYEQEHGVIPLPRDFAERFKLEDDEW